jgi:hypothetical protein
MGGYGMGGGMGGYPGMGGGMGGYGQQQPQQAYQTPGTGTPPAGQPQAAPPPPQPQQPPPPGQGPGQAGYTGTPANRI